MPRLWEIGPRLRRLYFFEDEGFKGSHLRLSASDEQQVVDVGEDDCASDLVGEDAQVSFDRAEAERGRKARGRLMPETRGATQVQGFVEPSIPAVR
jgi:hypothetical protein